MEGLDDEEPEAVVEPGGGMGGQSCGDEDDESEGEQGWRRGALTQA